MKTHIVIVGVLLAFSMWKVVHSVISFQQRVERKAAESAYQQGWIDREKQYKKKIIEAFHSGWHIAIVWNDCNIENHKAAYQRDSAYYFKDYFAK
jgi:hypothetical protein